MMGDFKMYSLVTFKYPIQDFILRWLTPISCGHMDFSAGLFFFFLLFLGLNPGPMEASRLEVELEPQLPAYTSATATWDLWTASATYTRAHGNARSLTHWTRPVIEPHPHGYYSDSFLLCHNGNFSGGLEFSHKLSFSEWDPRAQSRSCNIFYDLDLDVMLCHFHTMLLITQVSPDQRGKVLFKDTNTGSGNC